MDVHWNQVRATRRSPRTVIALRVLGASLVGSLVLCLLADTATMAVLSDDDVGSRGNHHCIRVERATGRGAAGAAIPHAQRA
jgi:hypothetical protein